MSTPAAPQNPLSEGLNSIPPAAPTNKIRYADIGINLSDPIFQGTYHGKQSHPPDLPQIITRALQANVLKLMITGSDLRESLGAVNLAKAHPSLCYATVGVHPCSAKSFDKHEGGPDAALRELRELAVRSREEGTAVAFGEIGLDYDRLQLCDRETQIKYFGKQLDLAVELGMPLFLHSRAAAEDFEKMLGERLEGLPKRGVVHSFTGTLEEMRRVVGMGFDVGINGCSLKTEENVAVVKEVPLERIQIETDGPWCEMRPSHASAKYLADAPPLPKAVKKEKWTAETMVKGRNEPCAITQVAHAVAKIKGISVEELCEHAWNNSIRMFGLGESPP